MQVKENNFINNTLVFSLIIIILCLLIGKGITVLPYNIPLIIVSGCFLFIFSFLYKDSAIILLIFAMLLSPEITFSQLSKQRAIVLRIEDLLIVVFFLSWLARTAMNGRLNFIVKTPINKFIGFYSAVFIISTMTGVIVSNLKLLNGIFYILKYLEYFFLYYLIAGILRTKKQVKIYLKAMIITFAIVNIYAFFQIGAGRVSAPFEGKIGEPNTLGGYQVLLLSIILGLLSHMRSTRWRWPLIGLTLSSLIPFVNTLSRSSYLAIIVMYLAIIIFNKSRKKDIFIGVLILLVSFSCFVFPQNVKNRIKYTFIPQHQETINPEKIFGISLGPSASARIQSWKSGFRKWQKRPFIGYGITATGFMDSQFIRNLAELGLIGFTAFIALLVSIYRNTLRIYKNTKDDLLKGLALGFLVGHIAMIAHALTANTFIIVRIMEPYWFLAAMVMMIPKLEQSQNNIETIEEKGKRRIWE